MSRFFMGFALWALLLALAACGGDSKGTDPKDAELADDSLMESILDKDSDSAKDAEPGEKVDAVVPSFDDLPSCTRDLNGKTAYVEDEDSAYVCKKRLWVVDDSLTKAVRPDSENKSSSSAKAKSSSNETSESSSSAKSSSSKDSKSSSSDEKSSSSSSVVPTVSVASPCKTATGDNCEYGTLTDDRDGQTYKTVKIGDQVWMAENLNYRYIQQTDDGAEEDSSSYCYNDDPANCAKYGRLYLWSAAMDSAGIIPGNTANGCGYWDNCNLGNVKVRGVCPEGWHLPDTTEWNALFNAVGGKETAGIMLKSTEGWKKNGNGSDSYFFSALPAGYRYYAGDFYRESSGANFWSSTQNNSLFAYHMYLYYDDDNAYLGGETKRNGFSVRCLKDYKSSSSEKNSSSSSVVPTASLASPCKTETEDNCEYGTLTDDRDGQTYKTVKIGDQVWMAENLNYRYIQQTFEGAEEDSSSYCYDDDPANCAKYGRLYLWSAAMDSAGIIPGNTANGCGYGEYCNLGNVKVRGVCPEGWHLPDTTEWDALFTAVGEWATVGKMLKSTEGWNDDEGTSGNGSDAYAFSALPAGLRNYYGDFDFEGNSAYFWSSTESSSYCVYGMGLHNDIGYVDYAAIRKSYGYGFSVRCLRD